jgi:hypothetical protein
MVYPRALPDLPAHDDKRLAILSYSNSKTWQVFIPIRARLLKPRHDKVGHVHLHFWLFFGSQRSWIAVVYCELVYTSTDEIIFYIQWLAGTRTNYGE